MRVLIATIDAELENLQRARRLIGYDRLVVLAAPEDEAVARKAVASDDRVVTVDAHRPRLEIVAPEGFEETAAAFERITESLKGHTLTVALCGGSHALQIAGLIHAYNHGLAVHVSNADRIERLPVFSGLRIVERLSVDERAALGALDEPSTTARMRERLGWDARRFGKTIGRLRNLGLIQAAPRDDGAIHIARSPTGEYYSVGRGEDN